MSNSFFNRLCVLAGWSACLFVGAVVMAPVASAVTVNEPPDFPNASPGAATTLTVGTNTFSGSVSTPSDGQDRFDVTVPAGLQISAVTKNVTGDGGFAGNVSFNTADMGGYGFSSLSIPQPLQAGTYSCIVGTNFSVGNPWTVTITLETTPDYTVSTGGGSVSVTDAKNNGDTMTLANAGGALLFAVTGRTFSINGGPKRSNDSGNLSLGSVTDISVNLAGGDDTLNISTLPNLPADFFITGGAGNDAVTFSGDITFAVNRSLDVDLRDSTASPATGTIRLMGDADLAFSGTGEATLRCSQWISVEGASSIVVQNGDLTLEANQQTTPTTGTFHGVTLTGAGSTLASTGTGNVVVKGRGGNSSGGYQFGVHVTSSASITGGTTGTLSVEGKGGTGAAIVNRGVTIESSGQLTSSGGPVAVTGTGGANSTDYGIGVSVLNGGKVTAGGTGSVTVTGTGIGPTFFNQGIELTTLNSQITSGGGNITIIGTPGGGNSFGLWLNDDATLVAPAAGGSVEVRADAMFIASTTLISSAHSSSSVKLTPLSPAGTIVVGFADAPGATPVLGLTEAELDRIVTPHLRLVQPGGGQAALAENITRASPTNLTLQLGTGALTAPAAGTDVSLNGGTLTVDADLRFLFSATSLESGYSPLGVAGLVALTGRGLVLNAFSGFAGTAGDTFTLIDNDGADAITGQFEGVPEGAYLQWNGSNALAAKITYVGGTGNDVILTLVPFAEALTVASTGATGAGTLHGALLFAERHAGPDVITFAPGLNGGTAVLPEWVVEDVEGVTVDASALSSGFTLQSTGTARFFTVANACALELRGLTLTGGGVAGFAEAGLGGAILNNMGATLTLTRCTLSDCRAEGGGVLANAGIATLRDCTLSGNESSAQGGGIYNASLGQLTLECCTIVGNTGGQYGGGVENNGAVTLRHCTFSANTVTNVGGGLDNYTGTATINHCILAGNSAGTTNSSDLMNEAGSVTRVGANIIRLSHATGGGTSSSGPAASTADPLLAPLGSYGGPTQTFALRAASPALNAATGSTATADQRGFPIVGGTPDLGAYEAGTHTNYNAFIWELLPATATAPEHAPAYDYDGDGSSNTTEWTAGTNPTNNASRFYMSRIQRNGAYVDFDFTTVLGRYYHLETSTNLTSWTPLETVPGTGSIITRQLGPIGSSPTRAFIRVLVNQSPTP